MTKKIRIDKFLWCIRVFKTRSQAAEACTKGKVKFKGENIKPSKTVAIADEFHIKTAHRKWHIRVTQLLEKRLKFSEAVNYYADLTPEKDKKIERPLAASFYTGKRQSKIGRPTKRQRRDLDDFIG